MKSETKRNWQALFAWITLMTAIYAIRGFADWVEVFIGAWVCLIVGGLLVLVWEKASPFKKTPEVSEEDQRRHEGISALVEGNEHFLNKRFSEALDCFDRAVECRLHGRACERRAFCLQALDYHLEAIQDFEMAISLKPEDSNLYYSCSMSRSAICDHERAMQDLRKAIELSEVDNKPNRVYAASAKEMGYSGGHTSMYVFQLLYEQQMKDMPQDFKDQRKARNSKSSKK